jgi:predicted phosphoadenosine phosphosulfate sulfurtransferase
MKIIYYLLFAVNAVFTLVQCSNENSKTKGNKVSNNVLGDVTIQDSVSYKNLEMFLIKGDVTANNIEYVPLKRAMEKKWEKITETSNVNEFKISNTSKHTVFIYAGDIIKGV